MKLRIAAALILLSGAAAAQIAPFDPIETRQAGFDQMAAIIGAMKAAVDAKESPKPLADSAKALARWGKVIPTLFPPGSDTGHNTHAKPDIWSNRAGFDTAAADFSAAAEKLADAAATGDRPPSSTPSRPRALPAANATATTA
jgi:cytochrome c556